MKYAELNEQAQQLIDMSITSRVCERASAEAREYKMAHEAHGEQHAYLEAASIVAGCKFCDAYDAQVDRIIATGRAYLLSA